jgi:hypothetical protein
MFAAVVGCFDENALQGIRGLFQLDMLIWI